MKPSPQSRPEFSGKAKTTSPTSPHLGRPVKPNQALYCSGANGLRERPTGSPSIARCCSHSLTFLSDATARRGDLSGRALTNACKQNRQLPGLLHHSTDGLYQGFLLTSNSFFFSSFFTLFWVLEIAFDFAQPPLPSCRYINTASASFLSYLTYQHLHLPS